RTVDLPKSDTPAAAGALSLGRVSNTAEVWVNGMSVSLAAGAGRGTAPGGGRGAAPAYALPAGVLRTGSHTITVRIQNNRNDGGFLGTPETMFVTKVMSDGSLDQVSARVPLAGAWRYRVERQTNNGALYANAGDLAAHVAFTAEGGLAG